MASELRQHAIRIGSNYVQLIGGFVIGIAMVPILLRVMGQDGFGMIGLLGGTTGILLILREAINKSLTPELGSAYHKGEEAFREQYASAITLSAVVAVVIFLLFLCLIFVLPALNIPDALMGAAKWIVVIQAFEVLFRVALAAPHNLLLVQERFIALNCANLCRKIANLTAGLTLLFVQHTISVSESLVLYTLLISGQYILIQLVVVTYVCWGNSNAIPRLRLTTRVGMLRILHTAKWNVCVACAQTLHLRIDMVLMSVLFGITAAAVMTVGVRLTGYMRQLVYGFTIGLDAVAVRISHHGGDEAMRSLTHHVTRIHAVVVAPAATFLIVFAEPIIRVWVTGSLAENPDAFIRDTAIVIQALTVGFASRAVSDSWMQLMYGAGHVRRYAPMILTGAILNPVLGIGLYFVLPEPIRIISIAAGTSAVFFTIHFIGLPIVLRRTVGVPLRDAFQPLFLPVALAMASLPVPLVFMFKIDVWNILWLGAAVVSYGVVYGGLCLSFAMDRAERSLFVNALRRRLPPALGGRRVQPAIQEQADEI